MSNLKVNNIEPYSNQNVTISGSLTISGSGDPIVLGSGSNPLNITSSYAITASYALNGGGGGGGSDFPYTGSAIISGSLEVTGSTINAIATNGPININGTGVFTPDTRVNLTKNGNTIAVVGSLAGGSNDSVGALLLYNNGVGAGSSGLVQLSAAGASYISSSTSTFSIGTTSTVSGFIFDVNGKSNFRNGISITGSLVVVTQSSAPGYTGVEGEIVPVEDSGTYYLYTYIGGAWRSASLA